MNIIKVKNLFVFIYVYLFYIVKADINGNQTVKPRNFIQDFQHMYELSERTNDNSHELNKKIDRVGIWNEIIETSKIFLKIDFQQLSLLVPNVSQSCLTNVIDLITALVNKEEWALRVVDAYGKPTSGIFEGSLIWSGEFTECVNINIESKNWHGKYCSILREESNDTSLFTPYMYGMCVPKRCSNVEVANLINFGISNLPPNITDILPFKLKNVNPNYISCEEDKHLDTIAIITIIIISLISLIVIIATLYDLKIRSFKTSTNVLPENNSERVVDDTETVNKNKVSRILISFSIYSNAKKIFHLSESKDQLTCIHSIRVLSSCWVILGHIYFFAISATKTDNILKQAEWMKRVSFLVITNGVFAVDSFFTLSGILTAYLFMKEINKPNFKLSGRFMLKYYLHRLWRLSPPYMIILLFSIGLTKYLGTGPFYPSEGFEPNRCKDTWWTNILYINNLLYVDKMCFTISWYLSNDMQLHWISPIFLIPFVFRKKYLSYTLSTIAIIASIITIGLVVNEYPGGEAVQFATVNALEFSQNVYLRPFTRVGPFVIGLNFGYIIYVVKKNHLNFKIRKVVNLIAWIITLIFCFLMIFGLFPDTTDKPLSRVTHIFYQCFSRTVWAICLGYIIFACVTNHGGIINKILSSSIWVPFSRLSYSTYLVHSTVITYFYTTLEHPVHLQDSVMIVYFLGLLVISYAFGLVFSLFFEIPLIGLEKFVF